MKREIEYATPKMIGEFIFYHTDLLTARDFVKTNIIIFCIYVTFMFGGAIFSLIFWDMRIGLVLFILALVPIVCYVFLCSHIVYIRLLLGNTFLSSSIFLQKLPFFETLKIIWRHNQGVLIGLKTNVSQDL